MIRTRTERDVTIARRIAPRSHRSFTPDPTRLVVKILMPLLVLNVVMWKAYAHNGWIAGAWLAAFFASFIFLKRSA